MTNLENMKEQAAKYILEINEDWKEVWLLKHKGEVKLSVKRAIQWVEAGIDSFDGYSKQAMLDILNSWK